MSVLMTILFCILLVGFLIFLSLGLMIALGVVFVVGLIASAYVLIFGSGTLGSSFRMTASGDDVPQKFNHRNSRQLSNDLYDLG